MLMLMNYKIEISFSATIIQMAGYTDNSQAIWFSVLVAGTNALFTLVSLWLIDRAGRRKLLLSSMIGMILGINFIFDITE